jgi:opacity protein-like surface antigen
MPKFFVDGYENRVLYGMMKFILTSVLALCLAVSAVAATNQSGSLFNAKELQLNLGTSYVVDYQASSVGEAFASPYDFNLSVGAAYYPWRNLGLEAWVPFYQTKGLAFSEVQAGLVFRLPLAKEVAVFKNIAPYVGLGGAYNWEQDQEWTYIAKVGAEWRFNKKWGLFAEGQYRNQDFDWGNGATTIAGGLKLVF